MSTHPFRRLLRTPAFSLAAILTLALGTGATGAVFTLVNAVLLRPLPFEKADEVGLIWAVQPSGARTWLSFPELEDLQDAASADFGSGGRASQPVQPVQAPQATGAIAAVAGLTDLRLAFSATPAGAGQEVQALAVSHSLLPLLGVTPSVGRRFTRDDDREGAAAVAVLGERFWRAQFGGDRRVIGRTITLNERAYEVIGILPASFELLPASSVLPERVDVWLPLEPHLASRARTARYLHALARLRPGHTFAEANAEVQAQAARMTREFAADYAGGAWTLTASPFSADVLERARSVLGLLFGLVVLVLVMACLNVAHLLLARGETRRIEIAIRVALGAGPARLAGELLAEACLLALAGTLLGFGIAVMTPAIVRAVDPAALPRLNDAAVDTRVIVFMTLLMLAVILISALAPAIERWWMHQDALTVATRSVAGSRRGARTSKWLVATQTAFATAIVICGLLMIDMLRTLQHVDLGFDTDARVTARVSLSPKYPAGPPAADFFRRAIDAVEQTPGVTQAAAVSQLPLSGAMLGSTFTFAQSLGGDSADTSAAERVDVDLRTITPRYFSVMDTSLVAGRAFADLDSPTTPPVAIIDETFARRLDPSGNVMKVVGRRIRWIRQPDVAVEIVGVVRAMRHRGPASEARATVYRPMTQLPRTSMFLVASVSGGRKGAVTASALRAALDRVDPSQPLADVLMLEERLQQATSRQRLAVLIASILGGLAVLLGAIGLYGVISVAVSRRMREFGIRLAVGATPRSLRTRVLAEGLTVTLIGMIVGLAAAAALTEQLTRVFPLAPRALPLSPWLAGACCIVICAISALWIPARRASTVDPLVGLRGE